MPQPNRTRVAALTLALATAAPPASAGTFTVLHAFTGGADGSNPLFELVQDKAGNLYGTAFKGANNCTSAVVAAGIGCGTLWKIDTSGKFSVLVTFTGSANGAAPAFLAYHGGKLYGTTKGGGAYDQGVLYSVETTGKKFTILHAFNGTDGCIPYKPVWDTAGDLVDSARCGANNTGEIFKITPGGAFSVLYSAAGDSGFPGRVVAGPNDSAYALLPDPSCATGATGCGLLNRINPATAALTQLTSFAGTQAGIGGELAAYEGGTLYGVTQLGTGNDGGEYGYGAFFAYNPAKNKLTILHQINQLSDGWAMSLPIYVGAGTFYGTSFYGGSASGSGGDIYSITKTGAFTVLYNFTNSAVTGAYPESEPVWNEATGTLYGTTYLYGPSSDAAGNCISPGGQSSGYGCGTVFSFKP
jgi:uncharacterized repeat protein (TIGR03803 family)